jgi:hypothetical protein
MNAGALSSSMYWSMSTSLRTSFGRRSATSSATSAPSLQPPMCADSMPSASISAMVCCACAS